MKGILRKYPIEQFYYADISTISVREKYVGEVGIDLPFHHICKTPTILLYKDGYYVDLLDPRRELFLERENGEDCEVIHSKHSLGDFDYSNMPSMPEAMNSWQAICFFLKNQGFLREQSERLEKAETYKR